MTSTKLFSILKWMKTLNVEAFLAGGTFTNADLTTTVV
jgi:hypothetical protein